MTTKITNANITNTGVSAGSYTNTNLTVNAQGQITAASNGTGGGGTPGGSDTQVQFNDSGSFGGDAGLTYNKTTDVLTVAGAFSAPAGTASAPSITTTGDTNTGVFFPAADTVGVATGGAEAARINSSGTLILKGGSTSATGVGITFPADTTTTVSSNANTLDDYEEGTWTPTLNAFTGTTGRTASGKYTKIGRTVFVIAKITTGSDTLVATSNSSALSGLPFTVATNDLPFFGITTNYVDVIAQGSNFYGTSMYTASFSAASTREVWFSGTYQV